MWPATYTVSPTTTASLKGGAVPVAGAGGSTYCRPDSIAIGMGVGSAAVAPAASAPTVSALDASTLMAQDSATTVTPGILFLMERLPTSVLRPIFTFRHLLLSANLHRPHLHLQKNSSNTA
jgi:hypothetical protein